MAEHRVPILAASRRFPDPETSTDPAVREVLSALRTLEIAPPPRAHFRAELRAQLVAVAPRLVAEGEPTPADAGKRPLRHVADSLQAADELHAPKDVVSRIRRHRFAKPIGVLAAACVALGLLLAGAVWISKGALPGDALYGLKRASENAELSMASGSTDRGKTLLKFARTRTNEVLELLGQPTAAAMAAGPNAEGGISGDTAKLVRQTLDAADGDTRDAAKLLATASVRSNSAAPLNAITSWAPGQQHRFEQILAHLPAGSLYDRAAAANRLFQQATERAQTLQAMVGCPSLDSAPTDQFGPVPPASCQIPSPPTGTGGSVQTPSRPAPSGQRGTAPSVASPNSGTGQSAGPATAPAGRGEQNTTVTNPTGTAVPGTTPAPVPTGVTGVKLPTGESNPVGGVTSVVGGVTSGVGGLLSSALAPASSGATQAPVVLKTCSVGVHLGGLNVNLGSCPAN